MDTIEFATIASEDERRLIRIRINGHELVELVRRYELPYAEMEGEPSIAGGYVGLPSGHGTCMPSRHFFGDVSNPLYRCGDKIQLLECECGEPGCWPLLCRIAVQHDTVVWSDFEQPHRAGAGNRARWSYERFGPFMFDRYQYTAALEAVSDRLDT